MPASAVAAATPAVREALATLDDVNAGSTKGKRYEIRAPLAHVGRGAHNDVAINDDSVSDAHAKLRRRESGWVAVDKGSTNGTYVGGSRVSGEQPIDSTAAVRFGGVKMIFRATPDVAETDGGTRVIVGIKPPDNKRAPAARPIVAARQARADDSTETTRGVSALVWIAAAVVVGATILFVIQDR